MSKSRPLVPKTSALPLSYTPKYMTTLYMLSSEREGNRTPDGSYVRVLQTRTTHIADSSHSLIWDISDSNRGLTG